VRDVRRLDPSASSAADYAPGARGVIANALEARGQNPTMAILYLGGVAGVVARRR